MEPPALTYTRIITVMNYGFKRSADYKKEGARCQRINIGPRGYESILINLINRHARQYRYYMIPA